MRIAFVNQKGGVGKTSVAVNVAGDLVERGYRVLCVDLDQHAGLTEWLRADGGDDLADSLLSNDDLPVVETASGIDVVPASEQLVNAERELALKPGGGVTLVHRKLQPLQALYDAILIDTAPRTEQLLFNAYRAADGICVVADVSYMTLTPIERTMRHRDEVERWLEHPLQLIGIVPNRLDSRTNAGRVIIDYLKGEYSGCVLPTIRQSIRVTEGSGHGLPLCQYARSSAVAGDIRNVTSEILKQFDKTEKRYE